MAPQWHTLLSAVGHFLPRPIFAFCHISAIITAIGDVAQLGERGVRNAVTAFLLTLSFT